MRFFDLESNRFIRRILGPRSFPGLCGSPFMVRLCKRSAFEHNTVVDSLQNRTTQLVDAMLPTQCWSSTVNITAFPQFFVVPLQCRHLSASVLLSLSVRIEDKKSLSVLLVQTADPIVYQRRAFSCCQLDRFYLYSSWLKFYLLNWFNDRCSVSSAVSYSIWFLLKLCRGIFQQILCCTLA